MVRRIAVVVELLAAPGELQLHSGLPHSMIKTHTSVLNAGLLTFLES